MKKIVSLVAVATLSMGSASAFAAAGDYLDGVATNDCLGVPTHAQVKAALVDALSSTNNGLDLDMWITVVNRFGVVCHVANAHAIGGTGSTDVPQPWLASRAISAQKAATANSLSSDGHAISTANLFTAVKPGESLYGLQHSNPVDPRVAYRGDPTAYATSNDPMVGFKVGGVNVFGGGLALYEDGLMVGAIGVSGDTSCSDHNIAWRAREFLNLDFVPGGVHPDGNDNIVYDVASGWNHVACGVDATAQANAFTSQTPTP